MYLIALFLTKIIHYCTICKENPQWFQVLSTRRLNLLKKQLAQVSQVSPTIYSNSCEWVMDSHTDYVQKRPEISKHIEISAWIWYFSLFKLWRFRRQRKTTKDIGLNLIRYIGGFSFLLLFFFLNAFFYLLHPLFTHLNEK